jgi:hypothetical protein
MKTHLLYVIIGVLLAGNVALLLKKTPLPAVVPHEVEQPRDLPDRVVRLDSLILRRWSDNALVKPDFRKPTFLFLFSRTSCATCVDKAVDFLSRRATPAVDTYIISTDVDDPAEREAYDARYLRSLPFYALESVRRTPDVDVGVPFLMVINTNREALYVKQILPSDDLHGEHLFWQRINFLYSLLAL